MCKFFCRLALLLMPVFCGLFVGCSKDKDHREFHFGPSPEDEHFGPSPVDEG